ncbi:HNH endonuclease [Candidatus Halobonum tyrrellensis]|uniref:Putative restriction endonuclease n=1 Tax=Candidatus Halobonum tyrrellensis G22 TaxID=1324957 RepID=V4HBF8_9EURY|nr:HNH endonuclease [Candidatus Halobonum tyrrellensis]ESP88045.1 putative restriction endonuclease [Candidatus Halobonum tyrrellensis G22]
MHHLHRRSDGGADDPDNVVALCPNCHRRVHHGREGETFEADLVERVRDRSFD